MSEDNSTKNLTAGIYVFSKPVAKTHGKTGAALSSFNFTKKLGYSNHLYLLKVDENGEQKIIRGGPVGNNQLKGLALGKIENQIDVPFDKSYDYYEAETGPETRYFKKLPVSTDNIEQTWEEMKKTAQDIQNKGRYYDNVGQQQNSNSVIGTILKKHNFKPEEFAPEKVKNNIPGYGRDLFEDISPQIRSNPDSKNIELKKQSSDNYKKIFRALEENNNPKEDILYKHPSQIPESELKESMVYAGYEAKDLDLKQALQNKTQEWFNHYYSAEPMKQDAAGKNLEPKAKFQFPSDIVEAKSKDNLLMSEAFRQVAERTTPLGVKSLQKGLNNIYVNDDKKPQLKEDNFLGPKTTSRTKEALVNFGTDKVKDNIGIGGFSSFLEDNRKKPVDNELLKNTITSIKPEDGGSFLQKGLNSLGNNLKEDNDIGPKTTLAFNQIKDEKEDDLISYFKKSLI